ncbi:MAG TPA: CesT family type III secretion system chaperone [Kofleriaceae bacterium]|nr:CesT family type III secretion system chaperone [Kofleriaceae bacterium]
MSDDALATVGGYLERFAKERNLSLPPLSADGTSQVQRGSAVVTIRVLADRGLLLLLARVAEAPPPSLELYRRLLEASFLQTGDAAFAIHDKSGDIYLRVLRSLDLLDYEEFEDLVHTIATVADEWDDRLKQA